jgi:hypothetical protein
LTNTAYLKTIETERLNIAINIAINFGHLSRRSRRGRGKLQKQPKQPSPSWLLKHPPPPRVLK